MAITKEIPIQIQDKAFIQKEDCINRDNVKYTVTYEEREEGFIYATSKFYEEGRKERTLISFDQIFVKSDEFTLSRIKENKTLMEFGVGRLFGICDGNGKPFIKKCFNERKACLNVLHNVFVDPSLLAIKANYIGLWYEIAEIIYKGGYTSVEKGSNPILEFVYVPEKLRSYKYQDLITMLGFEPVKDSDLFIYRYFVTISGIMVEYAEEIGAIKREGGRYVDGDNLKKPLISSVEGSSVERVYCTRTDVINSVGNTGIITNFCELVF